jgi:hypothetical protein
VKIEKGGEEARSSQRPVTGSQWSQKVYYSLEQSISLLFPSHATLKTPATGYWQLAANKNAPT